MAGETRQCDSGQAIVEYVLLLALIAAIVALALSLLGVSLGDAIDSVVDALPGDRASVCEEYYGDDFSGDDSEYDELHDNFWRGDWEVEDGQLIGSPLSALVFDGYSGSDYTIDVNDVQLSQVRKTWQGWGVSFRASTDGERLNGYMFEIEKKTPSDSGVMYFSKWVNGNQVAPPLSSVQVPAGFDWEASRDVRIDVRGNEFTAYLDGGQVLSATDPNNTFTEGSAGLAANWGSILQIGGLSVNSGGCD